MRTIELYPQIDSVLREIDQAATEAIKNGMRLNVEWSTNEITNKQFRSMHLWCRMCEQYLNENGFYRPSVIGNKRIPWQEGDFKQLVYKPLLRIWKGKDSTKKQNTKEPEEIRLALSGHLATEYKENILLPEWPSAR